MIEMRQDTTQFSETCDERPAAVDSLLDDDPRFVRMRT